MCKTTQLIRMAVLVASALVVRGAGANNLSPNPSFESWSADQPDDWIVFGVGSNGSCDECLVAQDTTIFRSGTSSLRTESVPGPFDFGFPGVVADVASLEAGDYDPDDVLYGEVWVYDGQQDDFEDRNVHIEIKFVPEGCDGSDSCVTKHRPSISAGEIPDNQWTKLSVTSPPVDDFIESVQFAVFTFTNGPSREPYTAWFDDALMVNLTKCDLDGDGVCDPINGPSILQAGDADQDLDFDQLDLVRVQVGGKYLTGRPATWGEGDFNGAPGGSPGNPPPGDGVFDTLDIIKALQAGVYLTGPYAALNGGGEANDQQTSIGYDATTGEVWVDAPAGRELTSINIDSDAAIFTGSPAQNLGGSFDNDTDGNLFKATFGSSFTSVSFGNVARSGLSEEFLLNDLTVIGSLAGGGGLGDVDLIYVAEPTALLLGITAAIVMGAIKALSAALQRKP